MKGKKLKYWSLMLIAVAVISMSLAGCGGGSDSSSNTPPAVTPTPTPSGTPETPKSQAKWLGTDWNGSSTLTDGSSFLSGWSASSPTMTSRCSIADGYFVFDTNVASTTGNFNTTISANTVTVIAKMKSSTDTTNLGMVDFDFTQGGYRQRVQFTKNNTIQIFNGLNSEGKSDSATGTVDNFSKPHTYMVSFTVTSKGIVTNVYVDGSITPVVTGTSLEANTKTQLAIADGGGTLYLGYLDWFYYTTDSTPEGGPFTPKNVVLPTGVTL